MAAKKEEKIVIQEGDALSVTDVQHDFLPGGALAIPEGDQVIPPLNRAIKAFHRKKRPVFFTRDWHPPDHCSFKEQGGPWPPHCVQNTAGAGFHPDLEIPEGSVIVSKADKKDVEEYSSFYARDKEGNAEKDLLEEKGTKRLFIGGLATDYCVKWTAMEAGKQGFRQTVLIDASLGVNLQPHDSERAIAEMVRQGADLITVERLAL